MGGGGLATLVQEGWGRGQGFFFSLRVLHAVVSTSCYRSSSVNFCFLFATELFESHTLTYRHLFKSFNLE